MNVKTHEEDVAARLRRAVALRRDYDNVLYNLAEALTGHGLRRLEGDKYKLLDTFVSDLNDHLDSPDDVHEHSAKELINEWSKP